MLPVRGEADHPEHHEDDGRVRVQLPTVMGGRAAFGGTLQAGRTPADFPESYRA